MLEHRLADDRVERRVREREVVAVADERRSRAEPDVGLGGIERAGSSSSGSAPPRAERAAADHDARRRAGSNERQPSHRRCRCRRWRSRAAAGREAAQPGRLPRRPDGVNTLWPATTRIGTPSTIG